MTHMAKLVPSGKRKDFQAEVYGVCHATDGFYFERPLLDAMIERKPVSRYPIKDNIIYLAVDPASHQKSEMAFVSLVLNSETGQTVIVGAANVGIARFEIFHIQAAVQIFVRRTIKATAHITTTKCIIPIIECNNNEVVAIAIKTAIQDEIHKTPTVTTSMPFTTEFFSKGITPNIGIWTTEENKLAGIQELQSLLIDGRITVAHDIASVSRECLTGINCSLPRIKILKTLVDQLARVKDTEKGAISGKTSHGDQDDMAIALVFGIYWSSAVRIAFSRK